MVNVVKAVPTKYQNVSFVMLMLTVSPKHHRTKVQPHRAVGRTLHSNVLLCPDLYATELNGRGTDNMENRWGILEAYGCKTQTTTSSVLVWLQTFAACRHKVPRQVSTAGSVSIEQITFIFSHIKH